MFKKTKRQVDKMFVLKSSLVLFLAVIAVQLATSHRIARSPDKMEIETPNYSVDRVNRTDEFNDRREDEEQYWQGEGERYREKEEDRYEKGGQDREQNREEAEEKYDSETQHYEQQEQAYNKEMNEAYNNNANNMESHYEDNKEHYNNEPERPDLDYDNDGIKNEFTDKGDRYGGQGEEFANDRKEDAENYEMEYKGPSFNYERE